MENLSYDKLVELITAEVVKQLGSGSNSTSSKFDLRPKALVIGEAVKLPNFASQSCCLVDFNDFCGDISQIERIYITRLSQTELADIAQGRNDGKVQSIVADALLYSKKIYLTESALEYKKLKQTANRNYYMMLEGYMHTLQSFGIEIIREQWHGKALDRNAIADNTAEKVITEKTAKQLVSKCEDVIKLRNGTVITPSAKDVFNHSGKKVEFVD